MKLSHMLFVFAVLLAFAGNVQAAASIGYFDAIKNETEIKPGETYFMRHGLKFERTAWDATNYWRGTLLPINAKVTLLKMSGSTMTISWEGAELVIKNSKNTKVDLPALAKRMFSRAEVPINKFGDSLAGTIAAGEVVKGMTREQVIMARGYPPAHETPSIASDNGRWIYWSSRYVKITYVFKDGVLTEGRGL